ncbi:MAG TPA: beta-galactosidase [Candidatus Acidoferrales bacterium]|nr:beta-galactosidase [Candidatus Acidoferrales bacterium]
MPGSIAPGSEERHYFALTPGFRLLLLAAATALMAVFPAVFGAASAASGAQLGSKTHANTTVRQQSGAGQPNEPAYSPTGEQIVQVGGYPELHVDGKPFFIHSAAFFYYRIPRDMWEPMLDQYRRDGINTLDIYIPWNWHEPKEGEFDFDGHTNPRRDLRTLLSLIEQKGFRLIARPGPEILNEWRHGGYPGWLLDRPEYKMDPLDWIEGRYAPLDNLNPRNAEAAAQGWLDNPTHMHYATLWMAAVARELAPYSSHRLFHVEQQSDGGAPAQDVSGPLLFVQVGDDFAINRTNYTGPAFWRYVEDLRGMLKAGGLDAPVFINPTDMRVSAAGSALDPSIGAMGQWYMHPNSSESAGPPILSASGASEIELFTEELKTQPDFPPVMIEYDAGWYTPADDDRPLPDSVSNTLLSSRLLIANGIHGLNYFPLQDTYTPAGYSVPWANRSYRWDAALSPNGDPQTKMQAVARNAQFLDLWGPMLAASHKRADFGIIYPLGAYPQQSLKPEDILSVSDCVMRIERLAELDFLSTELVDPQYQPVDQLLRDAVLFLRVFDPTKSEFQLSDRAQQEIVDYVRRGGTLVVFPTRPPGNIVGELWKNVPEQAAPAGPAAIRAKWKFGDGEVVESSADFSSWVSLDQSFSEGRSDRHFHSSAITLGQFLAAAQVRPAVRFSGPTSDAGDLIASEIVTDQGTSLLGKRTSGRGFLSVTNISDSNIADAKIEVMLPSEPASDAAKEYVPLTVAVPPLESMLLPLEIPACPANAKAAPCDGTIVDGGGEFLGAEREQKKLDLSFYVPARAEVNLHLAQKPARIWLDQTDTHPESTWTPTAGELHLTIPRGAAPDFRRTLKIEMPHAKSVAAAPPPDRASSEDLDVFVVNGVELPTSGATFLRTSPALVVPDPDQKLNILLLAINHNKDAGGRISLSFDKPLHGDKTLTVPKGATASETIEFHKDDLQLAQIPSPPDHLFHTVVQLRIGRDHRALPVVFLIHKQGVEEHYKFDFDGDGANEWVLENDHLRLIVSPESGGRVIALTDKASGENLSTSVGLLRDNFSFTENPPGINAARRRGRYGMSNRPYRADWGQVGDQSELRLHYRAPDVFPSGATIDKRIRFEGDSGLRIHYRVALGSPAATATGESHAQSFIWVNSFPAEASSESGTRFCWQPELPAEAVQLKKTSDAANAETCRDFTRDGNAILVPKGVSEIEIRNPGHPTIKMAWDCSKLCGQMTIEPKYFSALLKLQFPPFVPGASPADYVMHIRVVSVQ